MACRWVIEGGVRFHVPDCWGTLHDPDGPCCCPDRRETLDERLDVMDARLDRLAEAIGKLDAQIRTLVQ